VTDDDLGDLELVACQPERDGELIRALTRANFYDAMKLTWNEERHQREPVHPERYRMIRRGSETIGFFAVRAEPDHLYVQTIQLAPAVRGAGIGTRLMHHIRRLAIDAGRRAVRLRVLHANAGARRLYDRLGYTMIEDGADASVLELVV
jgi:ribosomal protein S18 acetylase RimI-like enzyme